MIVKFVLMLLGRTPSLRFPRAITENVYVFSSGNTRLTLLVSLVRFTEELLALYTIKYTSDDPFQESRTCVSPVPSLLTERLVGVSATAVRDQTFDFHTYKLLKMITHY